MRKENSLVNARLTELSCTVYISMREDDFGLLFFTRIFFYAFILRETGNLGRERGITCSEGAQAEPRTVDVAGVVTR